MASVLAFVRANETADLEATLSTFAESATVFLPGDPPQRATGKSAARDVFRQLYRQRAGAIKISLSDVDVQQFDDMAVVTAHLGAVPPLPVAQPLTFARRTFVLGRIGERWWIVHLHASNVLLTPAQQTR